MSWLTCKDLSAVSRLASALVSAEAVKSWCEEQLRQKLEERKTQGVRNSLKGKENLTRPYRTKGGRKRVFGGAIVSPVPRDTGFL